jgi:hypothetical protein
VSRIIVHKTALVEDGGGDSMSDVAVFPSTLSESTEIIHSREDEELAMVQSLIGEIEKLDEGEALVIYKVII